MEEVIHLARNPSDIQPSAYRKLLLELVSKVSSASVDDMRAAISSNFAKQSSVYLSGYTSGCFARFPRLVSPRISPTSLRSYF
jgi:hypothetical protein